ncbi:hypothetical protein DSL72_007904 [Monilinia vaccinii-corymbosi]|uniref:F-box domain-containing protein n=1 Tax=Monilinia vaccinii-corymbosi TaxID=61207 RepID=A0A8A3PJ83_9HELO|nr:hypothetical protein DSL72_007904 [Monilinia vaccinii-corymbosi]
MPCNCPVEWQPLPTHRCQQPFISDFQLSLKCPLDDKSPKSFTYFKIDANNFNNPGPFIKMQRDIFQRILKSLDIESLFNVRLCSQYCREAVSSILEWREISDHVPDVLRVIIYTGVGSNIPLLQLHHALTHAECEFCPENSEVVDPSLGFPPEYLDGEKVLGGFISLFEGKRACAYCLRNDPSLKAIDYMDLIRLKMRPDSAVKFPPDMNYPRLRTIPGKYRDTTVTERISLVSLGSIEMIPGKPLSDSDARVLQSSPHIPQHPFQDRAIMSHHLASVRGSIGFERKEEVARRYMTAMAFPFFGTSMDYPNRKICTTMHGCKECFLQERYHEVQFLDAADPDDDMDEEFKSMREWCAANIYKRETRLWLHDLVSKRQHAMNHHNEDEIDHDELEWREMIDAPVFNLQHPNVWMELSYCPGDEPYYTGE